MRPVSDTASHADLKDTAAHGGQAERLAARLAKLQSENADGKFDHRVQRLERKLAALQADGVSNAKPAAVKKANNAAQELSTELKRAASLARKLSPGDEARPVAENAGASVPQTVPDAELDNRAGQEGNGAGAPALSTPKSAGVDSLKEAFQSGFSRLSEQLDLMSSQMKRLQQDHAKLANLLADFQQMHERFERMFSAILERPGGRGGFLPLVSINVGLKLVRVGQSLFLGLEQTRFGGGEDLLIDMASRFARAASLVAQRNNAIQLAFGLHTSSDGTELVLAFSMPAHDTLTGTALDTWV